MSNPEFPKQLEDYTVSDLFNALQKRGLGIQSVELNMDCEFPTVSNFTLKGIITGPARQDLLDYMKAFSAKFVSVPKVS